MQQTLPLYKTMANKSSCPLNGVDKAINTEDVCLFASVELGNSHPIHVIKWEES